MFWWTAWGVTAATVVVYRIGEPIRLNLRHRLRVVSVVDEGDQTWSVTITGRKLERLRVEAGQFFGWRFLNGPGWTRANPYSLSAAPDGSSLRITVQAVGDGSAAVRDLKPGTRALIEGPFGRLSHRPRTKSQLASLRRCRGGDHPVARPRRRTRLRTRCCCLPRTLLRRAALQRGDGQAASERGLHVLRVGGSRRAPGSWLGSGAGPGDDVASLRAWVPDVADRDVYVCGPGGWTALVLKTLSAAGVPDSQVHLETFAW